MSTSSTNSKLGEINSNTKLPPLKHQQQVEKSRMFDSQSLLSSKGPLGSIWVAGYFFKRLKKRQVTDTNIPSSVDIILLEGLPSVTYRVLAYLLLGVVRIYSKKAEYLYQDCDQIVSDINRFSLSKKTVPFRDIVRFTHSISLPKRYELDTFQLEVTDDAIRDHVSQKEDIILKEVDVTHYLTDSRKHRFEEGPLHLEELDNTQALSGISMQQNASSSIQTPEKLASDKEASMLGHTPPDNVFSPPQLMDVDVELSSPNRTKGLELSKEKLREIRFNEDDGLGADMICELDVELLNLVNDYDVQNNVHGNEDNQERSPLEKHDHVLEKDNEVPSPVEKISGSNVADPAAASNPKFVLVPTPVKKENFRRPNKRKCMFDETTTLNAEIMKLSIKDASDLVCKRRKAPRTVIDLWRFHRVAVLLKDFLEPIIPCVAMEFKTIHCRKKTETQPTFEPEAEPDETMQIPGKMQVAVSPRTPADSRSVLAPGTPLASGTHLAPGTPVRCSTSARVFGNRKGEDSDVEGIHSYDNIMREAVCEEDPGPRLMDEMDATEGDSQEIIKNKDGWSTRTRTVAKYLHEVYQSKKKQGEEAVSLLPILKRKTKGESARLFFEVLVLSSGGFMKVAQQKAYEDVLLEETSKMEAALQ
ncbi:sister chromatid cohesion 1 protein 2 [Silene latifolia]|uniref:sister chromatid cohesion 1 protein 2 n=1 Tax=Silene latifolia TaxID=37657 RepID=UPI003D78A1CD